MTLKPLNGFELYFRYLELAEIFSKHVLKARWKDCALDAPKAIPQYFRVMTQMLSTCSQRKAKLHSRPRVSGSATKQAPLEASAHHWLPPQPLLGQSTYANHSNSKAFVCTKTSFSSYKGKRGSLYKRKWALSARLESFKWEMAAMSHRRFWSRGENKVSEWRRVIRRCMRWINGERKAPGSPPDHP